MAATVRKFIIFLTALIMAWGFSVLPAHADAATDTLTIRVGYNGMPDDQYVNAGTYHWSELLKNITPVEAAYSFFEVDNIDASTSYETVVDSANGFYLDEILNFAKIDLGEVISIGFYVNDHRTIFTRFDTDDLFADRYYFHDLPGHRRAEGDSWNFDDAWNDYEPVYPMLAIEDNWRTYSDEIEHVDEDFTNLKTESRFRLLFGQREPDEIGMQKKSAKYISAVYVTIKGKPSYSGKDGKNQIVIDGKIGGHTTEIVAKVDNRNMLVALQDLLKLHSTNESVLKIKNITYTPDERYSDLMRIKIDYEILKKGKASITGTFGGLSLKGFLPSIAEVEGTDGGGGKVTPGGGGSNSGKKDSKSKDSGNKNNSKSSQNKQQSTGKNSYRTGSGYTSSSNNSYSGSRKRRKSSYETASTKKNRKAKTERVVTPNGVYRLSDELRDKLDGMKAEEVIIPDEEPVTQLKVPDRRKENKKKERIRMAFVGLGCAGIMGIGGAWEEIMFRRRLRTRDLKKKGEKQT